MAFCGLFCDAFAEVAILAAIGLFHGEFGGIFYRYSHQVGHSSRGAVGSLGCVVVRDSLS